MKKTMIKLLGLALICATLFSFSRIGGYSYTIHLNEKQLVQYYVPSKNAVPNISLAQATVNDQLFVYFNECGQIGTERKLSIRDEKDNILKEWQFANAAGEHTPMIFKAKEILALKKNGSNKFKLYYASKRVSSGQLLATIDVANNLRARR
ncbi:MAG TPA: hypothetical protein VFU05_09740 [Cyclobacteriaceae bacterium]|nr:hypothetical protein [Cyclobacteriaceae bacterium]